MNELIETIRAAVADGATDDARLAGAAACRTILTALEANAGEPMSLPQLGPALAALRNVPPDQILDLAIERLRAAVATRKPAELASTSAASHPLRFQIVPLDHLKLTHGRSP